MPVTKMGRPPKKINPKTFESLCAIQCTEKEIAAVLNCSVDSVERWCQKYYGCTFADIYAEKSQVGKASVRRYQFQQAEKNPTMAIWLGKQWLGQTDKNEAVVAVISDETRMAVDELIKGIGDDPGTGNTNTD
jgi:hypothetical protein